MRKNQPKQEQQNTTYQTGVTHSPKRSSGMIAFLLVLTIFLGGLASGMGIVNIRLLLQLEEQNQPSVPVNIDPNATGTPSTGLLPQDADLPKLPENRALELTFAEPAAEPILDPQQVYEKNAASFVEVLCIYTHRVTSVTGIVLSQDGYILTNAHGISSAQQLYVNLSGGQQYRAALVGSDILTDLAVLYIEAEGLIPVELGSSDLLQPMSSIHSVHSLLEERSGPLVSGAVTDPACTVGIGKSAVTLMQLDTGSVDGPIFNRYGQLVGLHVGGMRHFYGIYVNNNIGFAIPSITIQAVVSQLVAQGYVSGRPTLGIRVEPVSRVYQDQLELPGGLWVLSGTGSLQAGDILLAINGNPLGDEEDLYRALFQEGVGASPTAIVLRDGQTISVTVKILDTAA